MPHQHGRLDHFDGLAPGKTEAVVSWVGPGSRPIRRRLVALEQFDRLRCFRLTRVWTMMAMSSFRRWQRMTERCGSCSPIAILGRLCRLGLAWDGRSHHVPTLDRLRQVAKACVASRCLHQAGTWDELQGRQLLRLKVAWSRPWRIIVGAHRPPPPGQSWKSNGEVQKELQVAELEDELACMRLLCMARAARLAPPCVLAMLRTGAAAAWRSAVVEDMECMF